ncbi:hypothetical protein KFL_003810090 [Klebsormidium nitens]|uniref:Uncharacterized protein n=1 Tax=Klebsormidium nitens TaxID=105231 RepID=A0A1Y1IA51_KLENI|nr:hypothetical protein KFL_003810090 [Klebsormidium nitens]|eukprot:GAQ87845.1 hypothetical protein KFL_003810090 [Klebsormidium nitens]
MDPRGPSPKRLRFESLREEEIVIPRITEWQFETPEGAEEGEITSARPSSSRHNVDLPARLRPIRWRNIGRSARRGGLWNQVLDFLAWEADCRRSGEGIEVEQRHESGRRVHQSVSNEGEETGALGGIEAWGETTSDGLDRGDGKAAPFLCPQPLPSGMLGVGTKAGPDEAREIQRGGFEARSQSEKRPSTVESTLSPSPLANPEKARPAAHGEGGPISEAELLGGMSPQQVSGLASPTLKEPKQPSASPAEASPLIPPLATNGTPVEGFQAADATPASVNTGPSGPQTATENGSREGVSGNAAPETMSRGTAEVFEGSKIAKVSPCEVEAVQDVNHVEQSTAPETAEAASPKTATDIPQGAAFGAGPGNGNPCKLGALHDVHHFEQSKASACLKTAADGLQGATLGVGQGPELCGVGEGDEAGTKSAPTEGCQQAEASRSGDTPPEEAAQPANEIGTGGASTTSRASVGDGPVAHPADSVDDLALSARIAGAHKGPGQGRCKPKGQTGAQQLGARGSASGAARSGDLAGGESGLPCNGTPCDGAKEGVPGNSGSANVPKDLPEVPNHAPPLLCPPSKDCHVASSDQGAVSPTESVHARIPKVPSRLEEQTQNGDLQQLGAQRPTFEALTRAANQGETGATDRPVLGEIPRLPHRNTLAAEADEESARIPKRPRREESEAAPHKGPRVSPRGPAKKIVETPNPVGGESDGQARQQHISASLPQTIVPDPASSVAQPFVDPLSVELTWGVTGGEKDCGAVPNNLSQQGGPLALTNEATSLTEGGPKSEALLPGGSSLELPDMSDVELAALLEHVPLPDGDAPHAVDGNEPGGPEEWSLLGQSLLGSFKSLPCLLTAAPPEVTVPDTPRNRSLKRSFSEMDVLTGARQAEPTIRPHVSKKATFVVTVPAKRFRPSVEARVVIPSMDAPTVLESTRNCNETEDLDSPTMSTSFIDRDMALFGLTGLGTSLEEGQLSPKCCPPANAPTLSKPRKGRKRATRSVALVPSSFALTKPRNKRKGRGSPGKQKSEELALDEAQEDSRRALLLAEIAREISERERVVESESLLLDSLQRARRIKLCVETIDIR